MYLKKQLPKISIDSKDQIHKLDNSIDINPAYPHSHIKRIILHAESKAMPLSSIFLENKQISWRTIYMKLFNPFIKDKIKSKNGSYITLDEIEARLKLLLLQIDIDDIITLGKQRAIARKNQIVNLNLAEEKNNDFPSIISYYENHLLYKLRKGTYYPTKSTKNEYAHCFISPEASPSKKSPKKRDSLINCLSMAQGDALFKGNFRSKSSILDLGNNIPKKEIKTNHSIYMKEFNYLNKSYDGDIKLNEISHFLAIKQKDNLNKSLFGDNVQRKIKNLLKNQNDNVEYMERVFNQIKEKFKDCY